MSRVNPTPTGGAKTEGPIEILVDSSKNALKDASSDAGIGANKRISETMPQWVVDGAREATDAVTARRPLSWRRWISGIIFLIFYYHPRYVPQLRKLRNGFYSAMLSKIKDCGSRDELKTLFEAYQLAKNDPDIQILICNPIGRLPKILRWSRFQDHRNGQTFPTSETDSLIIKVMKQKRDDLERDERRKGISSTVDDSELKNFKRKAWYTSNIFLIGVGLLILAPAVATLLHLAGIVIVPVAIVAGAIVFKIAILTVVVAAAFVAWNFYKGIAHSFRATAARNTEVPTSGRKRKAETNPYSPATAGTKGSGSSPNSTVTASPANEVDSKEDDDRPSSRLN